jgi:hypothetical protein
MPANHVLLEKVVVGAAGANSVTFNSIPQTGYTDLKIVMSARGTGNASARINLKISFNGSTTTFSSKLKYAESNAVGSQTGTDNIVGVFSGGGATASSFGSAEIYIPNYTSSAYKSFSVDSVSEINTLVNGMWLLAGLWSTGTAISSVSLIANSGDFAQHSTFSLYGIATYAVTPVIAPFATGGDVIQSDGTYWYHAFLASGTFTPLKALSCDVLVVAGGGSGGGSNNGGGGGAGGYVYSTSQSVAISAQTVTVGAGGSAATQLAQGNSGSNSQFASLTAAVGGGGGGSQSGGNARNGGSGGGAGNTTTAGTATAGQGFAGGSSGNSGGGGAGAIGGNGSGTTTGGTGGVGLNTWSTWLSPTGLGVSGYVAGGGGAGASTTAGVGGTGGGGTGSLGNSNTGGTAGTMNTGGGGGGGYLATVSGGSGTTGGLAGGSGLVIIRYPMV